MQYNDIYEFKINYIDKNGNKEYYSVYSDDDSIYSLKNLPDTTFFVEVSNYKEKGYEIFKGAYLIGEPLTLEDLENEIKTATDKDYIDELKAYHFQILSLHVPVTIFRIENKLICLTEPKYKGQLAGRINDGKIVNGEIQIKQEEQSPENEYTNDNYTDLE